MSEAWPDYCKRETLAKRLNLAVGVIDQYVKRGILPKPILVGEALLWRWADVDKRLAGGQAEVSVTAEDPYLVGVTRAREASTPRSQGPQ